MDKAEYHIAEAEERLGSAKLLLQNEKYRDAVSRAYYCMYHAARGILILRELSPKTHRGLIQKFGEEFVKTEKISREYSTMLAKAEDLREIADYDVVTKIGAEEAEALIGDAERFLERIKKAIEEMKAESK